MHGFRTSKREQLARQRVDPSQSRGEFCAMLMLANAEIPYPVHIVLT
jgi:hypothetical protein